LTATLKTIDYSVLQQCMHCGMCLPTCPTYDATGRERNSPRGRISLMRAIADGDLEVNRAFADEMSYCLGCLACQTACPAGVNYAVLFETARSDIQRANVDDSVRRRFWRGLTLNFLFMRPKALRGVGTLMRLYQRSGFEALARQLRLTRLLPADLRRLEPQAPAIASRFSDQLIAPRETPRGTVRGRIAVLTGCVQDLVFPDINRDTVDAALANGFEVETPRAQPCCGSLHAHNGETDMAKVLARRLIDLVPPDRYDAIISNAGGCGSHLRHYSHLLEDDPAYAERARQWERKVRDVQEWLVEVGCRPPARSPFERPTAITYHESCHLVHGQKISRQPRALLALLPDVTLTELPESSWCCGSAGIYTLTQPEQAEALLKRKVANVKTTGATIVATANPGCHLQIARGLKDSAANVQVVHPVSLLAAGYRREAGRPVSVSSFQLPVPAGRPRQRT
jgi:glycolate oxidase iron-sulfur subunit